MLDFKQIRGMRLEEKSSTKPRVHSPNKLVRTIDFTSLDRSFEGYLE
jgi:hypothetical protein